MNFHVICVYFLWVDPAFLHGILFNSGLKFCCITNGTWPFLCAEGMQWCAMRHAHTYKIQAKRSKTNNGFVAAVLEKNLLWILVEWNWSQLVLLKSKLFHSTTKIEERVYKYIFSEKSVHNLFETFKLCTQHFSFISNAPGLAVALISARFCSTMCTLLLFIINAKHDTYHQLSMNYEKQLNSLLKKLMSEP